MSKKPDYDHWFKVWSEVCKSTDMTLPQFCARECLNPEATRKAFARRRTVKPEPGRTARKATGAQWDVWKLEFLAGDFKTVSEFVRSKGLDPSTGHISRMTKGWSKELGEIRAKSQAESVAQLADSRGAEALAKLHGRVLTALYQCLGDLEANGSKRAGLHEGIDSVKDNTDFLRGVNVAVDTLLKILPSVSRIEAVTATRDLLQRVLDQGLDVTAAAIQFDLLGVSLPDSLRILLSKTEPTEPEVPENAIPSDDELETRWREGLARISRQEENFVPERQKEIEELKRECKDLDSFSDDAI